MAKDADAEVLNVAGREVRVTHPGKPYFWKQIQVSKLDVVRYYLSVAEGALRGIRDRPVVLKRFVNGADKEPFFQKRAPTPLPPFLHTANIQFPSGRFADLAASPRGLRDGRLVGHRRAQNSQRSV